MHQLPEKPLLACMCTSMPSDMLGNHQQLYATKDNGNLLLQVGFWDGSLAVVRLQPSSAPSTPDLPSLQASRQAQLRRKAQHDMVVLTHFQVEPTPLRAVAWCPPEVIQLPPPPLPLLPCLQASKALNYHPAMQ